ncbi:MAG: NPCBM/NEW2 domain-containing protein [Kiritimatiellae bacterium]|nr:NPCBM/NEW2 domain-containing protein [Kiritimatiellia bacterium]MDD5523395.1 NPCBM/NEW2 domain-containing protein [Kiritimatiellia bacterium]
MQRLPVALMTILLAVLVPTCSKGWGGPHSAITEAALRTLPDWQKELLGDEFSKLGSRYCSIPDEVFKDKQIAKYAMMDSRPGVVYLVSLHLPASQQENYEQLRYFMDKTVNAFKSSQVGDAARYAGTLAHMLEDWGCPAHSVPGDNMFTLFKQYLPPPSSHQHALLHGPVENGSFTISVDNYCPRQLGNSVDEAAFRLLQRAHEAIINARGQVIPIIQGLYAGDTNAVCTAQQKAATLDATIVADALYTVICLGAQRPDPKAQTALQRFDISSQISLESTNLFRPQAAFFGRPYWGYPQSGVILRDGTNAVPLVLRVEKTNGVEKKQFASGIGTGTRSSLTYLVPPNVYQRFEALVGLHAELGTKGNVVFEVSGNGKSLARIGPVTGDMPAKRVDVPLDGVTNLQLVVTSGGGDGKGNYAIWAEPQLVK